MCEIRPIDELIRKYFQQHPEETIEFIQMLLDEYDQDGDLHFLLRALRSMCPEQASACSDKEKLKALATELKISTTRAKQSLDEAISEAEQLLAAINSRN